MKSERIKEAVLILVSIILGGVLTFIVIGGKIPTTTLSSSSSGATCSAKDCTKVLVDGSGISEAVEKAYDGVVVVRNYQQDQLAGFGTGFVYKMDDDYAYILSNHHVIDGNTKVTVVTSKDEEIEPTVLGSDSYADIAVIRIKKHDG